MKKRKARKEIFLRFKYKKEKEKSRIGWIEFTNYQFKLYWTDEKKRYVVRLAGEKFLPILLEAYIAKYWTNEGRKRFEEFCEILQDIEKKWYSAFKLFVSKYLPNNQQQNDWETN